MCYLQDSNVRSYLEFVHAFTQLHHLPYSNDIHLNRSPENKQFPHKSIERQMTQVISYLKRNFIIS